MVNPSPIPAPLPAPQADGAAREPKRWDSTELLGAGKEALVHHRGETYRLRLTAAGKLILTK